MAVIASAFNQSWIPGSVDTRVNGFLGGGQIGHNWQNGNYVVGLEADIDGLSAKGSTTVAYGRGNITFSREMDWVSTVRARAGYMVMPAFLIYGTAGLAVGETRVGSAFTNFNGNASSTTTSVGWTAGAGVEWMFAPGWSVKGEYLYVDLGDHGSTVTQNYTGLSGQARTSTLTSHATDTAHIVRAGVNYHF